MVSKLHVLFSHSPVAIPTSRSATSTVSETLMKITVAKLYKIPVLIFMAKLDDLTSNLYSYKLVQHVQ